MQELLCIADTRVVRPSNPRSQRITLKIVAFQNSKADYLNEFEYCLNTTPLAQYLFAVN